MKHSIRPVVNSGVALGGLGTGTVEIRADGLFYNWQIFNNPPWTSLIPGSKNQDNTRVGGNVDVKRAPMDNRGLVFLFWARRRGDTVAHLRLLALDNNPLDTNRFYIPFLRTPKQIDYFGEFPVARLEYKELGVPLEVTARFTSSYIPSDTQRSAIPGFYADFSVTANDARSWDVSITAIMTNATGFESPECPKRNVVQKGPRATVILMDTPGAAPDDPATGTMALAAEGRNVSFCAGYCWINPHRGTADRRYLFTDLYASGRLPDWPHGNQPPRFPAKLRLDELADDQRAAFEKACKEHYDISRWEYFKKHGKPEPSGIQHGHIADNAYDTRADLLGRQYGRGPRWEGSLCVNGSVAKSKTFEARFTVGWHFPNHIAFDSETGDSPRRMNMGHEYAGRFGDAFEVVTYLVSNRKTLLEPTIRFHDALFGSTLPATVIDQISAQLATLPRCSWWTSENGFGIWEGLGCCGVHTTDVAYGGSVPIPLMFPDLSRHQLDLTRKFQREDGRVPHLFPASFAHPNDAWYRTDMMAQYVLMVYRDWRWTGNIEFVNRFYPSCVKAMRCMAATDADGNGLPDAGGADTTYDTWGMFGATAFMSGLFLSAISALEKMAIIMDDGETAHWAHESFDRGKESLERELWNGSYLRLWHRIADNTADEGCMADQFAGFWYSKMLGLAPHLDAAKTRRALKSIMIHNFIPGRGLINGAYPAGQTPPHQYFANYMPDGVWSGIEYSVASLMLYCGMEKEAAQILDDVYNRYSASGGIWRHDECGPYYYRPLSIWSVLLGYQKFSYDAASGALTIATSDKEHRSVIALGGGWGTFKRSAGSIQLTGEYGTITLKSFAVYGKGATSCQVALAGKSAAPCSTIEHSGDLVRLVFKRSVTIKAGQALTIRLKYESGIWKYHGRLR
jgi:uncharacterized protein (DUF608 family)